MLSPLHFRVGISVPGGREFKLTQVAASSTRPLFGVFGCMLIFGRARWPPPLHIFAEMTGSY